MPGEIHERLVAKFERRLINRGFKVHVKGHPTVTLRVDVLARKMRGDRIVEEHLIEVETCSSMWWEHSGDQILAIAAYLRIAPKNRIVRGFLAVPRECKRQGALRLRTLLRKGKIGLLTG